MLLYIQYHHIQFNCIQYIEKYIKKVLTIYKLCASIQSNEDTKETKKNLIINIEGDVLDEGILK